MFTANLLKIAILGLAGYGLWRLVAAMWSGMGAWWCGVRDWAAGINQNYMIVAVVLALYTFGHGAWGAVTSHGPQWLGDFGRASAAVSATSWTLAMQSWTMRVEDRDPKSGALRGHIQTPLVEVAEEELGGPVMTIRSSNGTQPGATGTTYKMVLRRMSVNPLAYEGTFAPEGMSPTQALRYNHGAGDRPVAWGTIPHLALLKSRGTWTSMRGSIRYDPKSPFPGGNGNRDAEVTVSFTRRVILSDDA